MSLPGAGFKQFSTLPQPLHHGSIITDPIHDCIMHLASLEPADQALTLAEIKDPLGDAAERDDLIFEPTEPGVYTIRADIIHWITGAVLGTASTSVTVV